MQQKSLGQANLWIARREKSVTNGGTGFSVVQMSRMVKVNGWLVFLEGSGL